MFNIRQNHSFQASLSAKQTGFRILFILIMTSLLLLLGCSDDKKNPVIDDFVPDIYVSGFLSFDYLKIALPPEAGTFAIEGLTMPVNGQFPLNITEVCGGSHIPAQTESYAFCYGGRKNLDNTVDIMIIVLSKTGNAVTTGNYPVSLTQVNLYAYLEGVEDFELPDEFDPEQASSWIETLTANRIFVSTTGSITVDEITNSTFNGSFTGTMASATGIFTVSNGVFSMVGL